jgi:hypothetical protein
LLIGHDLEEIEAPGFITEVALPGKGTGHVMVLMSVQWPMSQDNIWLHLMQPFRNGVNGRFVGEQLFVGIIEKVRFGAKDLTSSAGLATTHLGFWLLE